MTLTASEFFNGDVHDAVTEAAFFRDLKMRNGTFKRTRADRFAEIEAAFGPEIRARAEDMRTVLDVAVSSGITTAEFAEFLDRLGARVALTATDLFIDGAIVELAPGLRALVDPEGWPLQYDVGGHAFRAWVRRLDYATLTAPLRHAARAVCQRRARMLLASGRAQPTRMVSPRLLARPDIAIATDDILTRNPAFVGAYDLVRAANILNRSYFAPADLSRGLANVMSYVAPGGLLIVTRTADDGRNDGTLFARGEDERLEVLARVGKGSEVEPDILLLCG